jgi:hypothetical protein
MILGVIDEKEFFEEPLVWKLLDTTRPRDSFWVVVSYTKHAGDIDIS